MTQNAAAMGEAKRVNRLAVMAGDIKVSHSVFALPFALLAAFLAAEGLPGWGPLGLIVACMVFARTFAMLANRYVDRELDARNPRTAGRALPSGRLRPRDVVLGMIACGAGLVIGAAMFGVLWGNWWPAVLSPVVLAWLGLYGLMKRWTALCHLFLGGALAMSVPAAALAIDPPAVADAALWCLAGFVLLWVAGFDIIYALQDTEVDRRDALHSVPAKLGRDKALLAAKAAHLAALLLLVLVHNLSPLLGGWFTLGLIAVAVLLAVEHRAASRDRFTMAFFTVNGLISLLVGGLGIGDVLR